MKILLLVLLILPAAFESMAQCEESEASAKKALGEEYIPEPSIIRWVPSSNDSVMFQSLWLSDNTYRIATSASDSERLSLQLFDEQNNLIFDNSSFNYPPAWTFFVEHSMKIRCVVKQPLMAQSPNCVVVMTGFKK